MISKDQNFISNKLTELKKSVLNKNDGTARSGNQSQRVQFQSRQDNAFEDSNRKVIRYSIGERKNGGNEYAEEIHHRFGGNQMPTESVKVDYSKYTRTENPKTNYDKPLYTTQLNDQFRRMDLNQQKSGTKTYYNSKPDVYSSNLDGPRVINAKTKTTNYKDIGGTYTNGGLYNTTYSPAKRVQTDTYVRREPMNMTNYQVNVNTTPVLDNISKNAFMERYKINMADDLNGKMAECQEVNKKLESDINNLKRTLETEKIRTQEVHKACQDELGETQKRHQDAMAHLKDTEKQNYQIIDNIKSQEARNYDVG